MNSAIDRHLTVLSASSYNYGWCVMERGHVILCTFAILLMLFNHFCLAPFNMAGVPELSQKYPKAIPLRNYLTNEVFYDTLNAEADRVQ